MTAQTPIRGGTPVAQIEALPPAEARLIRDLRQWCDGRDDQMQVWHELTLALGAGEARREVAAFDELMALITRYGRRPLIRHRCGCLCVGSDEAVFANFVMTAATGEREDAMMVATLLVRPDMMGSAVALAQRVGLALLRLTLRPGEDDTAPASPTRH